MERCQLFLSCKECTFKIILFQSGGRNILSSIKNRIMFVKVHNNVCYKKKKLAKLFN